VATSHDIDIDEHLDLIKIVAASMPRARWLLSDDVYPQVQSEGWMGLREALEKFDPTFDCQVQLQLQQQDAPGENQDAEWVWAV
jgi:hypothetical protein